MTIYVYSYEFQLLHTFTKHLGLVWTDKYYGPGEFTLKLEGFYSDITTKCFLYRDTALSLMFIEEVAVSYQNGKWVTVLSGRDLTAILDRRVSSDNRTYPTNSHHFASVFGDVITKNLYVPSDTYRKVPYMVTSYVANINGSHNPLYRYTTDTTDIRAGTNCLDFVDDIAHE